MIDQTRSYWQGSVFVVDWTLVDTAGTPVVGATVTGTVKLPNGSTAAMTVTSVGNVYSGSYQAVSAGRHGWELAATGAGQGDVQGTFTVQRATVGLPPITVDPSTDIGFIRLLCTDLDEIEPLFEDAHIAAFLARENGRVKRAAALALETIATSEALVSKAIRTLDLQTDGPKVAAELRQRAKGLREQDAETDDAGEAWGLEIVDFDPYAAYRTGL